MTGLQANAEWEAALQLLSADALAFHVRTLVLDDSSLFGAQLVSAQLVSAQLVNAVGRLKGLTDISICNAGIGGGGARRLLAALSELPTFARTHAEVWMPMETVATPAQGARLCLMQNDLVDEDLLADGGLSHSPLRGLVDVVFTANPCITNAGLVSLAAAAVCRLANPERWTQQETNCDYTLVSQSPAPHDGDSPQWVQD